MSSSWSFASACPGRCLSISPQSPAPPRESLFFEVFIWTGYVSAIIGKIVTQNLTYVFYFYILNIVMVSIDICLYFRNRRLDALASRKA